MDKLPNALRFFAVAAAVAAGVLMASPRPAHADRVQCGAGVTDVCGSTCTATNWYGGCLQWRDDYDWTSPT